MFARRGGITGIKAEDMPKNLPNLPDLPTTSASQAPAPATQNVSSPARRNLFGAPNDANRTLFTNSPASGTTSGTSGLFGTSSTTSGGLGGIGSTQQTAKSPVATRLAAFKSGTLGAGSLSGNTPTSFATPSALPGTNAPQSSFLSPANNLNVAPAAYRPPYSTFGGWYSSTLY